MTWRAWWQTCSGEILVGISGRRPNGGSCFMTPCGNNQTTRAMRLIFGLRYRLFSSTVSCLVHLDSRIPKIKVSKGFWRCIIVCDGFATESWTKDPSVCSNRRKLRITGALWRPMDRRPAGRSTIIVSISHPTTGALATATAGLWRPAIVLGSARFATTCKAFGQPTLAMWSSTRFRASFIGRPCDCRRRLVMDLLAESTALRRSSTRPG